MLTFDYDEARWCWDLNRIHAKGYTDNVVDLMVGKLNRLSAETRNALQKLACLGNDAGAAMLRIAYQDSGEEMHGRLWEAVRAGLIFRSEDSYKFLHDRVQEAAYSLIPEDSRAEAHLRIGMLLAAQTPPERLDETIFEIVNQLNRGSHLITSIEELERVAELNLIAGKRAKTSTAYASALNYLVSGVALLPGDSWERQHDLIFELELHRAECEFLTGALAEAGQRLAMLSARAATTIERARVTCLQVDLYTTLDQGSRAIAVGLDYLRHLGVGWSAHPTEDEARREYDRIWSQLGSRAIEALIDLPLMSDPVSLATLDVLTKLGPPAHYTDAKLRSMVICRAVNLSLEGGNCDGSCYAYAVLARLAGPEFGDYQAGLRFGRLGYELVEQRGLKRFQARTYLNFGYLLMFWTRHVREGRDLLRRAFETANQIGDLTFAAYYYTHLNTYLLAAGDPLDIVQVEVEHGLAFARNMRFGFAIDSIAGQLGLIRTLRGLTPIFGRFDDGQFNELLLESRFRKNPDLALAEGSYWTRKLQARFFAGDYVGALEASLRAQQLQPTSASFFECAEYHFYSALSRAASCESAAAGRSMSRHWLRTTDNSRSGRRLARRTLRTAPHSSGRRSPGSKAARSMPNIFTSTLSVRHTRMAWSTTRRSPTKSPHGFMPLAGSRRSRMPICRTRGTDTFAGEPTARCANSTSCIRTSGRKSQLPAPQARSGHPSNNWIYLLLSKSRKPCRARSSWKS